MLACADSGLQGLRGVDPGAYAGSIPGLTQGRSRGLREVDPGAYAGSIPGLTRVDPGAYAAGLYDVTSSRLTCRCVLFGELGTYAAGLYDVAASRLGSCPHMSHRLLFASIHSYLDLSSGAALATRELLELLAGRG